MSACSIASKGLFATWFWLREKYQIFAVVVPLYAAAIESGRNAHPMTKVKEIRWGRTR